MLHSHTVLSKISVISRCFLRAHKSLLNIIDPIDDLAAHFRRLTEKDKAVHMPLNQTRMSVCTRTSWMTLNSDSIALSVALEVVYFYQQEVFVP